MGIFQAPGRGDRDIPVPEPELTPAEIIARAALFRQQLRDEQEANDARGSYSDELHEGFRRAEGVDERHVKTARGGKWTHVQVGNILARVG